MKMLISTFFLFFFLVSESCNQPNSTQGKEPSNGIVDIDTYLKDKKLDGFETAIVAGGCFWCVEAAFQQIDGIEESISGYAGGHTKNPTYKEVCTHTTGHTEAVYLVYDPNVISFETILDIFFVAHDPTTLNRQGPDVGSSYRSALFYQSEAQKEIIDTKIKEYNESTFDNSIVTEVAAYDIFWVAEEYHQDFYWENPNQGYVKAVSRPKVEKVAKAFKELLK